MGPASGSLGRAFFESLDGPAKWAEAPKRPEAGGRLTYVPTYVRTHAPTHGCMYVCMYVCMHFFHLILMLILL